MSTMNFRTLEKDHPELLEARCLECQKTLGTSFAGFRKRLERSDEEKKRELASASPQQQGNVRFAQEWAEEALVDPEGHFFIKDFMCPSCDERLFVCGECGSFKEYGRCIACKKTFELCPTCKHANIGDYERCASCGKSKAMAEAQDAARNCILGGLGVGFFAVVFSSFAGPAALVVFGFPAVALLAFGIFSGIKLLHLHFSEGVQARQDKPSSG